MNNQREQKKKDVLLKMYKLVFLNREEKRKVVSIFSFFRSFGEKGVLGLTSKNSK